MQVAFISILTLCSHQVFQGGIFVTHSWAKKTRLHESKVHRTFRTFFFFFLSSLLMCFAFFFHVHTAAHCEGMKGQEQNV